jgi:NitT/TauT family transport system substrate-binding protein
MRGRYLLLAALLALLPCGAGAEPVKIVNIGHGYFSGPLYVAKQEKLFEKHGLEPDITYVQGGALALQAVLTKQVEVGILSYEHVLTAAVQGKLIVSFFNIANRPVNNIIASSKLVAASEKLGVGEKVALLKGGRVGVPSANGSGEKMLKVLAKKFNLTLPGDISMAYLGAEAPAYVAAFQKDLVDAALPFEPAGTMVEQAGRGGILLNLMSGEVPDFRDLIFMTLTAHPDTVAQKPDLLKKVSLAFAEAQRLLKADPKRGKALMAKEYPSMTPESNERVYDIVSQIWTLDPRMNETQARATFAYLQPEGPHSIDYPKTFTNRFLPD